jgi:hypothetical protein
MSLEVYLTLFETELISVFWPGSAILEKTLPLFGFRSQQGRVERSVFWLFLIRVQISLFGC